MTKREMITERSFLHHVRRTTFATRAMLWESHRLGRRRQVALRCPSGRGGGGGASMKMPPQPTITSKEASPIANDAKMRDAVAMPILNANANAAPHARAQKQNGAHHKQKMRHLYY